MDKVADTINGVLVWAAVLEWAGRTHQADWDRLVEAAQSKSVGDRFNLQLDPPAMFTGQTYLIAMALNHMAKRLEWLQGRGVLPEEARRMVTEFLTLHRSEELKDLRDVLAHAHEYTVGTRPHKPELVVNRYSDTWGAGVFVTAGRISELRMFGRSYRVREVIEAAQRVAEALSPDSFLDNDGR